LKDWWRRVRPALVSGLIFRLARLIGSTLRITTVHEEALEGLPAYIICGFHGRSFVAANYWRNRGFWVIISQSRDGEIQKTVFERFGFQIIRGSTGRGGVRAALEGVRVLKQGGKMAITPDGPRGPSGVVQGGVMLMAQKSGAALVPIGISSKPWLRAKSWDRYIVPAPFARSIMIFGDPIFVPDQANAEEVEAIRLHLEQDITRLEAEADRQIGHLASI
jgi:lysophospholipid acyltransferase (LPLAT)-like uncharacterized protein